MEQKQRQRYPRTPHLPFSPGGTKDDERLRSIDHLIGIEIVILEKMDGACWVEERDHCHARNPHMTSKNPIFNPAKAHWANTRWSIEDNERICGEWLFYQHSLSYDSLPGWYLVFNIQDLETKEWYEWDIVEMRCEEMNLPTVPVLWRGTVESEEELEAIISSLMSQESAHGQTREGVVVRLTRGFEKNEWKQAIAKWVRKEHIQRDPSTALRNSQS